MSTTPRVRVYMASSFDGFIAGPDHDIDWLNRDHSAPGDLPVDEGALRFDAFMKQVGAMLMGRATYGVVERFGQWHYGDTPVVVATRRPLVPMAPTVRAMAGPIAELVAEAKRLAGDKDVYLDGGDLVRQAIDADLVDELTVTLVPVLLGRGIRLFDGLVSSKRLQFIGQHVHGDGLVQVTARVVRATA